MTLQKDPRDPKKSCVEGSLSTIPPAFCKGHIAFALHTVIMTAIQQSLFHKVFIFQMVVMTDDK
jgi:hypothetical protein